MQDARKYTEFLLIRGGKHATEPHVTLAEALKLTAPPAFSGL